MKAAIELLKELKNARALILYGPHWIEMIEKVLIHMQIKREAPEVGSIWQHHSGRFYEVEMIANEGSNRPGFPDMVVYRERTIAGDGKVYARPLYEWYGSMTKVE